MTNSIQRLHQAKQALRDKYAWPGGYPLYLIMDDGAALSIDGARQEWRQICYSHITNQRDGWRVWAVDVNWEDTSLVCCHTNQPIESAYGED